MCVETEAVCHRLMNDDRYCEGCSLSISRNSPVPRDQDRLYLGTYVCTLLG